MFGKIDIKKLENKKTFIFGTGSYQEFFQSILDSIELQINIEGYIDNDVTKQGLKYRNKFIYNISNILEYKKDEIFIIISSMAYRAISAQLKEMGFVEHTHFISVDELILNIVWDKEYLYALFESRIKKLYAIDDDMEKEFLPILGKSRNYTMTSTQTMYVLFKAIQYVVNNNVTGDIVECGVWRGGSSMISALTLQQMKSSNRNLYLYDTYEGMSEASDRDVLYTGIKVKGNEQFFIQQGINKFDSIEGKASYASLEEVKNNIYSTCYPKDKLHFVKGKVEDTLPFTIPDKIAVLRLDTDFYESTYHELVHLFPKLEKGGVLIIDDYGHCRGAREAVEQYFEENNVNILLNKIDYSVRIGIKI